MSEERADVRGTVVDREGHPISGAIVYLEGDDERRSVSSDALGRFSLEGPRGDEVILWTEPPGYAPAYARVVPPASDVRIQLAVESIVVGRVVEQGSRRPIAHVDVYLRRGLSLNFAGNAKGSTDSEGRFRIGGLEAGRYEPSIYPHTWRSTGASVVVGHAETTAEIDVEVERRPSVRGRVRLPEPVPDRSHVWLIPFNHRSRSGPIDSDGRFEVAGIDPGQYAIEVHAGPWIEAPVGRTLVVADSDVDGVELSVATGARLSGVVVDEDGAAIADATVTHKRKSWGRQKKTDVEGRFTIEGLRPERIDLEVRGPRGGQARFEQMIDRDTEVEIVIRRATMHATLRGRVVDADGRPVDGAAVEHIREEDGRRLYSPGEPLADGSFSFELVPMHYTLVPERYGLGELKSRDGASGHVEVDLSPGEVREIEIVVEPLREKIWGRVVDDHGAPLAAVSVAVARETDDEDQYGNAMFIARHEPTCAAITDQEGRFSIDRLGDGTYTVVAYPADGAEMIARGLEAGRSITLMLDPTGAITARVVDRNGHPPRKVDARASATWSERREAIGTPEGQLRVEGLSAGRWIIEVVSDDASAMIETVVRPGKRTDAGTIVLEPMGVVRGQVVDSAGAPIPGIGIVSCGPTRNVHGETNSEGRYELHVPAGTASVSVSGLRGFAQGEVEPGAATELAPIQLKGS